MKVIDTDGTELTGYDPFSRKLSRRKKTYYWFYRKFRAIKLFPREVKWFIQRGKRGYADCDTWGIDYYLVDIIPKMIKRLRENYQGIPTCLYAKDDWDENWQITAEGADDRASEKWNKILDEIMVAFKLMKKELDCEKLTKEEIKIKNKGVKQLYKYFYHLWY